MEAVQAQRMREHTAGQIYLGGGEDSPPAQACHLPPTWAALPAPWAPSANKAFDSLAVMLGRGGGGGKDQEQTQGREETSSP